MKSRIILAAIVIAGLGGPAFAHAFLQHASPAAGDTLAAAPTQITLPFTEQLEPSLSGASLTDANGRDMSVAPAKVEGTTIILKPKPLAPGDYHVAWHAVSIDAHRTEGNYSFTVKP